MSAVAEPATKTTTPFKKNPVKYHYRLGNNKMAPGMATGGQGKVLSVLSAKAYMTARDVANALRIESHVAQGLLQRLLIRGAVERRIIPGSVYDDGTTTSAPIETPKPTCRGLGSYWLFQKMKEAEGLEPADEVSGFDERFVAGSIVRHEAGMNEAVVIQRVSDRCLRVYEPGIQILNYQIPAYVKYIGPTPNPIAFNHGKYDECFVAPEPPVDETVKKVGEKVDEVNNALAAPFNVGDILVGILGGRYLVEEILPNGKLKTLGLQSQRRFDWDFELAKENLRLEKPTPKPTIHPRPELLPLDVLNEVSKVFAVGAAKYERNDWALPGNGGGDHVEAAQRHIYKFNAGHVVETGEKGSGLHHLDHAIARLMMARGKALRANQCS